MDLHLYPPSESGGAPAGPEQLRIAIAHAAHLLPAQGPIAVFIHHNTLHAFEHLPFDEAVQHGADILGGEPYLSEARYREALQRGRIHSSDLQDELRTALGEGADTAIAGLVTRQELRWQQLQHNVSHSSAAEVRWQMAETDALRKLHADISATHRGRLVAETRHWLMRDLRALNGASPRWCRELFDRFAVQRAEEWSPEIWEAFTLELLWCICCRGVEQVSMAPPSPSKLVRHRDYLWQTQHIDTDERVHDVLIRFTAAFLDQGLASWPLPQRDAGYWCAFCAMYGHGGGMAEPWLGTLRAELQALPADADPLNVACATLTTLGVPASEWGDYVQHTLLPLRGWAGMIQQIETRGDRVPRPVPPGTLNEFLAVRLLVEKHALQSVWRGPLAELRSRGQAVLPPPISQTTTERAFPLFQLAQLLGWAPARLHALPPAEWQALVAELEAFPELARRRLFHRAFERRYREQCLDALTLHVPHEPPSPRWQVVTCLDEREESLRRHLEECDPQCQTYGVAGFFAVPMYYRGATDAHFVPLCPIVLTPQHWVEEQPTAAFLEAHARGTKTRRLLGTTAHQAHVGTRSFLAGALLTGLLGVWATVPLVLRVLFPRIAARIRRVAGNIVTPAKPTQLVLEREADTPPSGPDTLGFTVPEMGERAKRLLEDIGLTKDFASLVFFIGHGSNSLNNPHKSAYDCGACGGSSGAPNGRAAAQMLNDPRVRELLAQQKIVIPSTTYFVGGYHNTCNDAITLFDLDRVPRPFQAMLHEAQTVIEQATQRNAHERARRFMSAPLHLSPSEARNHVEARSEDLAQTRPELGHATNALCIVGRRARTRGLYLDRRAFLTSYDPTTDGPDAPVLTRTLQAVFPVCGGINLEYYFSHVDPTTYGCGTKLPHNISALLGVMDGAASDLRTGLPWQMVEIHEPQRLLIVCETTPTAMSGILRRNPALGTMAANGWIQLAVLHPDRAEILVYNGATFEPYRTTTTTLPTVESSQDWYRGWREHLDLAAIQPKGHGPHA